MGAGPILIFDKSTLQSLSVDEAVWLDTHYLVNITPLFFVETLADLEKEVGRGRTPEQVVGNLAEKTPTGGRPNIHHATLCEAELLGNRVEMGRRPVIGGGKPLAAGGKRGFMFDQAPEIDAFQRWERGEFLEVERHFASTWRKTVTGLDIDAIFRLGREIIGREGRPKDLAETKAMAVELLKKPGSRFARLGIENYLPRNVRQAFIERWSAEGGPPLDQFAPYTAHVLTVDLFFCIGLGADLISRNRQSHKIDMAYLYYLPFCMVFTSSDNLHVRTAPLFLTEGQFFIRGSDLKTDLAKLDAHYSSFSEEIKKRGVMSFAHYPPTAGDFLVSRLWDNLMKPNWREDATSGNNLKSGVAPEKIDEDLREMMNETQQLREGQFSMEEADYIVVKRQVPIFKGKWRLLPPEVEKKGR